MMDLLFVVCWPLFIAGAYALAWKKWMGQNRLYILILLNMAGLSGFFYFFSIIVTIQG